MPDTVRTPTDLVTNLFQDGQTAGITAQDMRDLIVSLQNPYGKIRFSTPAVTTVAVQGTYYKAAGTTTDTALAQFDTNSVDNRLRYIGTTTRQFLVMANPSIEFAAGTVQVAGAQIWRYDDSGASGSLQAESQVKSVAAGTDEGSLCAATILELDENDYIELHIANHTGTNNMTVTDGGLFAIGLF